MKLISMNSRWLKLGMVALAAPFWMMLLVAPGRAQGQLELGLAELDRAICLNDWERAIAVTSGLMALPEVSAAYRSQLISFRQELEHYQTMGMLIPHPSSCDRIYPNTLAVPPEASPAPPPSSTDWSVADAMSPPDPVVQFDPRSEAEINPGIPPALLVEVPQVLQTATPLNTVDGFSVVAGQVAEVHQAYAFLARLGDRISLDVDVTQVYPGAIYRNDDSQLFLFDRNGVLLAENDDADGRQSRISDVVIPMTDVYFVVVTSHDNDPLLNQAQTLSGWEEDGGARFDYTLTLTGVTPSTAILR